MVRIFPFQGVRYNPDLVNYENVITPPYDVITIENQRQLYENSDFNLIRLEYGEQYQNDNENDNRYTRAASTFNGWLDKEVLIQDNKPVYYWYQQQFPWKGETYTREGLIATIGVEPYEEGNILPHEETLSKPKEDRYQLLDHCKANFSPIFGLYPDPQNQVEKECAAIKDKEPIIDFTDDDKQNHRIWVIEDPQTHKKLEELFSSWFVFLADGHHRYETALLYSQQKGYDRALIFLFNFYSPGLLILPFHRVIKGLQNFNPDDFLAKLQKHFNINEVGPVSSNDPKLPKFIQDLREKSRDKFAIGLCTGNKLYELELNSPEEKDHQEKAKHDVDILQKYVLEKTMQITPEELRQGEFLSYIHNEEEALNMVCNGEAQATFFLNPSSKERIMETAQEGEKLPQKSTYFYPKLVSGLLVNKLD